MFHLKIGGSYDYFEIIEISFFKKVWEVREVNKLLM